MLELVKIWKKYHPDIKVLESVSLSVEQGEMVFLTGESGAGKTTMMRIICQIEKQDKGLVEIDGQDTSRLSNKEMQILRRKIGVAYQDFKLLKNRTVRENVSMPMEVCYRKSSFIQKRTRDLLYRLNLIHKIDMKAGALSRGEQQRVSIARALANKPKIILADEPTGNLDRENTRRVMELFYEYQQQGTTIIITTHDKTIVNDDDHPYRIIALRNKQVSEIYNSETLSEGVIV